MLPSSDHCDLVEHYFRHEYGRLVALLTSQLGVRHLELAEDSVQVALSRALTAWPRAGLPSDPSAWLYRTARNAAIDTIRRQKVAGRISHDEIANFHEAVKADSREPGDSVQFETEIGDEALRLLFLCCHPAISAESQVALALKIVGGFGVKEIANGLLTSASNIEKRLTRAKESLREQKAELIELNPSDVEARIDSVLSTIYLIFNEGYSASEGESPIRQDLCEEAIRLTHMIADHPITRCPAVYALLSLFLLHAARFNSRQDSAGCIVLLEDQDRSKWNWAMIREAMAWATKAVSGDKLSRYHIEASIAWEYCRATEFAATDWARIAELYQMLLARFSTPMIRLNAAVARSYVDGPEAGRQQLLAIDNTDRKRLRPWWDCCMAQLNERLSSILGFSSNSDSRSAALSHWRDALALSTAAAQRQFIQAQIDRLES